MEKCYKNMKPNKWECLQNIKKLVLDLISGHQALLKESLDQQCDSLTSVKTDVEDFKESSSFTQKHIDRKFLNINEKAQNLSKELSSIKEDVGVIQTAEPTRELEICRKLADLEDKKKQFANTRY